MDAKELARLVQAMRATQRLYLKFRKEDMFHEAKRLEREVDRVVDEVLSGPAQASLFEEGDI